MFHLVHKNSSTSTAYRPFAMNDHVISFRLDLLE